MLDRMVGPAARSAGGWGMGKGRSVAVLPSQRHSDRSQYPGCGALSGVAQAANRPGDGDSGVNRKDERIYALNWLGKVRYRDNRFEIFARFVSEPFERPRRQFDYWCGLSLFPFLILGSRWYRGIMVGKPPWLRTIRLHSADIIQVHAPSIDIRPGALCFGDRYPLAFSAPASPVAEFQVVCTLTELYRAHYFNIPRALPSLLNGLHAQATMSPAYMAWDIEHTKWLDEQLRIAQIAPAKFLQPRQAIYLARILLSPSGRRTLDILRRPPALSSGRI